MRLARARVDANAIAENWRFFRKQAPNAVCAAVVKADGYGLGAESAARATAEAGARVFFTATFNEARHVRTLLGEGPQIFVLNGPLADDVAQFAPLRLTPVLNSMQQIALWNGRGPAALHIDTGMNRLGVALDELGAAAEALKESSPTLIMSHLACGSTPSHAMNERQRLRFIEAAKLFPRAPLSLAATSGTLMGADYHFDLIRPGIGLYGSGDTEGVTPPLAVAVTIEAPILQVRDVEPGQSFGYGAAFVAQRRMRTATVALGYADGFLRSLAGRGYGVLAGKQLPLLGRVSMDLVILDVSECAAAAPGAMVEFLGAQVRLDDVAACAGTSAYEILTGLAGTVRRMGAAV